MSASDVAWPEPKFLPIEGGQRLNPERVQFAFEMLNSELVIGEHLKLIEMLLDGTEYTLADTERGTPAHLLSEQSND